MVKAGFELLHHMMSGDPNRFKTKTYGGKWINFTTKEALWVNKDTFTGLVARFNSQPVVFTKVHIGCYADGANGDGHRRAKLAELVGTLPCGPEPNHGLITELYGEPPDDYDDEDTAIGILNDQTEEGIVWQMVDGDLLLIAVSELE